jgi:hypothetical protein
LHYDNKNVSLVELEENEQYPKAKNKNKDKILKLLSESDCPSTTEFRKVLGGKMQVIKLEDFKIPKLKLIRISEDNIRI